MHTKSLFEALSDLEKSGGEAALTTVIRARGSVPRHVGTKMLVYPDGTILGTIGGGEMESRVIADALASLKDGEPRIVRHALVDPQSGDPGVCGGEMEVFVEPIKPRPTVVVVGGGHVGKAVAHLAKWMGFQVVVADDRPEFASPERVPDADEYLPVPMADIPQHLTINDQTYLVLTTRGVPVDVAGLPALIESPAAYLGVIGSRRRWATTATELKQMGIPESKLARVHSPMGLELNAETPEEIALSIMAEIIMLRRRGSGESMKWMSEDV